MLAGYGILDTFPYFEEKKTMRHHNVTDITAVVLSFHIA